MASLRMRPDYVVAIDIFHFWQKKLVDDFYAHVRHADTLSSVALTARKLVHIPIWSTVAAWLPRIAA
jgi:hypothetical protein